MQSEFFIRFRFYSLPNLSTSVIENCNNEKDVFIRMANNNFLVQLVPNAKLSQGNVITLRLINGRSVPGYQVSCIDQFLAVCQLVISTLWKIAWLTPKWLFFNRFVKFTALNTSFWISSQSLHHISANQD